MAAPDNSTTLEGGIGGLPLVGQAGLNTNKPANFGGFQITASGAVTGPTGSFGNVNITAAEITGSTGSAAALGTAGASGGGPTVATQDGWGIIYINGVKCWIPVWK